MDDKDTMSNSTAAAAAAAAARTTNGAGAAGQSHHNGGGPGGSVRRPPHLSYRSRHRAANHDAAHDAAVSLVPPHLPDDPRICREPPELINDDAGLSDIIDHCRAAGFVAYDSEFIGELTYHPQLCVIQVATTRRVALIDPQAGVELRPFWELLGDRDVEKLVHAGAQDVEPVHRHTGQRCTKLFDTQVAAGFCGMAYPVALSKLVGEVLNYKMAKGLTFTDWQRRPLSSSQIRYAADDVRFLPALADELKKRLDTAGHARWVTEECEDLCDPARYTFDPEDDFLHLRGAGTLTTSQLAVLRELMIWREQCAVEADVPPRAFVRDEAMIDLARHPAKSVDRLYKVKFLPRPVIEQHGKTIVQRTTDALAHPPPGLKKPPQYEPTPTERFRTESLWAATQAICLSQGLDPAVVTSRQEIGELDRAWAAGQRDAVSESPVMRGWRREALGERLTCLLEGESRIALRWQDQRLRES